MSGQPVVHPTDASKFREQYLATLAQQIKNDDKNLQANKIYKRTGQTPSIVLDTRTPAEKSADFNRLKMEVRSGLKDIMDGEDANQVVQEFNEFDLRFLAQRLPEIVSILKPKYRLGIPFVAFQTFFKEYAKSVMESGDYLAGYQQKVGERLLMGIQQIQNQMINEETLNSLRAFIIAHSRDINEDLGKRIKDEIYALENIIPTVEDISVMMNEKDAITRAQLQKQLSDALEELPTRQQIVNLLSEIDRVNAVGDKRRQQELLTQLAQILAVTPETMAVMREIRAEIGEQIEGQTTTLMADTAQRRAEETELRRIALGLSPQEKAILIAERETLNELDTKPKKIAYINKMTRNQDITLGGKGDFLNSIIGKSSVQENSAYASLDKVIEVINTRIGILASVAGVGERPSGSPTLLPRPPPPPRGQPAEETLGSGLRRSKGKGVAGRGILIDDTHSGVKENPNRYVPFGRFHINTHRLNDDIINLKRHTGCNVDGFPVRRVSRDFGNIIRTIVGGGHPEYRHLEKLDDDEKLYLNQLVKKSNIQDRLSIPTPNRDDDDKDIHEYEVMKGEILSGNDNFDMVKKFKILIMKLMRKELLPKNQAKDILLDLATMGY